MTHNSHGIILEGVTKSYGETPVLHGIDLTIQPGEFLVLVGPSGCGKSTLLRCIAGLEEITGGSLRIGDTLANELPPKDRDLAMVFQSYALYPHMTVRENLGFSLSVRKMAPDAIAERVHSAADRLGLTDLLDRFPRALSGGQRQRVAVGRAIVRKPSAFLFDEPLSNLDAKLRGQLRVELKQLHRELETTMIYVTHDQVEAMTLADRIAILKDGVLQQVGDPTTLYQQPANIFVAGFIGSPPINLLHGEIDKGNHRITGSGFSLPLPTTTRSDHTGAVLMGIRPPSFTLEASDTTPVKARVDFVETLGWESYVHLHLGDDSVLAQIPSERAATLAPGQEISLGIRPEDILLFDPDTGCALAYSDSQELPT